jgi:hypothetical protein
LYYQSLEHLLYGLRVRLVKNEDRFLALVPINLNKLKKEDELHICDTYRAYLQTQEELTLEIKIMESKMGIISHKPCKTKSHLCKILELVSEYLLYFENFAYNATFYSNIRNIFQCFETRKDIRRI